MKFKLTLLHKKILAGIGLVGCIALTVFGYVGDYSTGLSVRLSGLMTWGFYPAYLCGEYLFKAIFKPEKLRQEELERTDERSQYMRGKAAYLTYIVTLVLLSVIGAGFYLFSDYIAGGFITIGAILVQTSCYRIAKRAIGKKM